MGEVFKRGEVGEREGEGVSPVDDGESEGDEA